MRARHCRRIIAVSLVTGVVVSTLVAASGMSEAAAQIGKPTVNNQDTYFLEQQPLIELASNIHAYRHRYLNSGYAGMRIDAANESVDVYWHGAVPGEIHNMVHATSRRGGVVHLHSANHSFSDLEKVTQSMMKSITDDGLRISSIGPNIDGSGVTLTMPNAAAASTRGLREILALSSVPVSVAAAGALQFDDRLIDTPPFWGGDFMQDGSSACTSGFAVKNSTSETFMLSAAHCSPTGIDTWSIGTNTGTPNDIIGQVAGWNGSEDAMIISTSSAGTVWTGTGVSDPSHQTALSVNGEGDPTVGEMDCSDGAQSGQVCGDRIVATGLSIQICESSCIIVNNIAQAEQVQHAAASGNGDSGGPVFEVINNRANARGTITAHDTTTEVPCQGVPTDNDRKCGWRFFFPDVLDELGSFGANVLTSP